jgi:hypothetical protein
MKPEFAARYLPPNRTAPYEFLFLWDGDAVLPEAWSPATYLEVARTHQLDISQPSLARRSKASFQFNLESVLTDTTSGYTPSLFVELGFMVFHTDAWAVIHAQIFSQMVFKYWCFDTLPFKCLFPHHIRHIGIIHQPVLHPPGRHVLGIQSDTPDPATMAYIQREISFARQLVSCHNCCPFVRAATTSHNNNGCFPFHFECPPASASRCASFQFSL